MKPLLPSKGKKQAKIVLMENDHVITDSLTVAKTFNNYFCEPSKIRMLCGQPVFQILKSRKLQNGSNPALISD